MAPPFLPLVLAPPVCLCLSLRASACLFMRACIDLNVCVRESLRACVRACVRACACVRAHSLRVCDFAPYPNAEYPVFNPIGNESSFVFDCACVCLCLRVSVCVRASVNSNACLWRVGRRVTVGGFVFSSLTQMITDSVSVPHNLPLECFCLLVFLRE